MAAIHTVYVHGHKEQSDPKSHIIYRIEIPASMHSWQMWRQYSEFDDLNMEYTKLTGSEPPATLPSKHILSFQKNDKEQQPGLKVHLFAFINFFY